MYIPYIYIFCIFYYFSFEYNYRLIFVFVIAQYVYYPRNISKITIIIQQKEYKKPQHMSIYIVYAYIVNPFGSYLNFSIYSLASFRYIAVYAN